MHSSIDVLGASDKENLVRTQPTHLADSDDNEATKETIATERPLSKSYIFRIKGPR